MIILGFYKYVNIKHPEKLMTILKNFCDDNDIKGTILLGQEGINASVSGIKKNINKLKKFLITIPRMKNLFFKEEESLNDHPFKKMKLKVRDEIVSFGSNVDIKNTGRHISPVEMKDLYDENGELRKDVVVIDARNDYEYKIGRFRGAIHYDLDTFREMPDKVNFEDIKDKKVVMYCTGGIRCEKASAYLRENGVKDISQLNQGIINFGAEFRDGGGVWDGKCFVFDKRMVSSMNNEGVIVSTCKLCGNACDFLRNCKLKTCNLFYVSCYDCEQEYSKCCSRECAKEYLLESMEAGAWG